MSLPETYLVPVDPRAGRSSRSGPPPPTPKSVTVEFTPAEWAKFNERIAKVGQSPEAAAKLFIGAFVEGPDDAIAWMHARHTGPAHRRPPTATEFAHLAEINHLRFLREHQPANDLAAAVGAYVDHLNTRKR